MGKTLVPLFPQKVLCVYKSYALPVVYHSAGNRSMLEHSRILYLAIQAYIWPLSGAPPDILYYGVTCIYTYWCHTSIAPDQREGIYTIGAHMVVVGPVCLLVRERNATLGTSSSFIHWPALPLIITTKHLLPPPSVLTRAKRAVR